MTAKALLKLRIVVLSIGALFPPCTVAQETTVLEKPVRKDCYGDPLPEHALVRIGSKRSRQDPVVAMHFLNQSRTLISIGQGGTVYARDSATGLNLWQFNASSNQPVNAALFTDDGQRLLVVSKGRGVIWDTLFGHIVCSIWQGMRTDGVAFSADGTLVAAETAEDQQEKIVYVIKIWDAGTGKLMANIPKSDHKSGLLVFAEGGRSLIRLQEEGGAIQRWDCATGQVQKPVWREAIPVYRLFTSDSGKLAAYVERELFGNDSSAPARFMSVLDLHKGKFPIRLHNADGQTRCLTISSGDERVYAASYDIIHCWNLTTGQMDVNWEIKSIGTCVAMALSGDGQVLATAAVDGPIRMFDVSTRRELSPQDFPMEPMAHVAMSPDGRFLATNGSKNATIEVWDAVSGQRIKQLTLNGLKVNELQFTESSNAVLAGDESGTTHVISVESGLPLRTLPGIHGLMLDKGKTWVAVGHKGTLLICDFQSGRVRQQWKVQKGTMPLGEGVTATSLITWCGGQAKVEGAGQNQTQQDLQNQADNSLRSWDMSTGKQLLQDLPCSKVSLPEGNVTCSALAFDNRHLVLSGWNSNFTAIVEMASGTFRQVAVAGPKVAVNRLCFSPDGFIFASAWSDGTVRLWDVASGSELACLADHSDSVTDLAFSRDGRKLISASADATALIWDVELCIRPTSELDSTDLTMPQLWKQLDSTDPRTGLNAVRRLIANPVGAMSLIEKYLKLADEVRLRQLFAELDSKSFLTREKADAELTGMGELIKERLETTLLQTKSAEVAYRCRRILRKLASYPLERKRAMQVLEWIDSDRARAHLKKLAAGPKDLWLARDAQYVLTHQERSRAGK